MSDRAEILEIVRRIWPNKEGQGDEALREAVVKEAFMVCRETGEPESYKDFIEDSVRQAMFGFVPSRGMIP